MLKTNRQKIQPPPQIKPPAPKEDCEKRGPGPPISLVERVLTLQSQGFHAFSENELPQSSKMQGFGGAFA